MNRFHILACSALLALGLPALAQSTPAPQAAQPKEPDPDPTMLRAMKSKVFEVQHRDPVALYRSLRSLGSGVKGSVLDFNSDKGINTLTVRDFPENLAAIEEALKRLDTPAPQQKQSVELRLQVLFASKAAVSDSGIPEGLQGVVKTLKSTLAYRSYTLGADFIQRARVRMDESGGQPLSISGFVDPVVFGTERGKEPSKLRVECQIQDGIRAEPQKDGSTILRMKWFELRLQESGSFLAQLGTDLSLKEGETVVVGTSVVKDLGMVVVLTARRVN